MNRISFLSRVAFTVGWLLTLPALAGDADVPPVGRLQVTSDPPKATVLVDRQVRGETPIVLPNLAVGQHLVSVQKQGFHEALQSVDMQAQGSRVLDFRLESLTGLLLLQSAPSNADITINGVALGRTPILLTTLPLGTHRVKISTPGYQPKEVEVKLEDRTPVRAQVDLVSDSASLTVESDVDGATVRVNGIERGSVPCTVDRIPGGEVTVELHAEGYLPLSNKMRLAAGEVQKIKLPMTPLPAGLRIVSIPDKARVYVNNEPRGQTPLELNEMSPGKYRVRVEKEGYDPNARDIELGRGVRKSEEFRLSSNTGRIELISEPDRVTVYLDGRKVGETRAKADATTNISEPLGIDPIPAGEHELRLVRKGYAESKQTVQVVLGQTLPLSVKLVRRFIPDCLIVTVHGTEYRGMLDSVTDEAIRLETKPGCMTTLLTKDVKYRRVIREDGSLE